jgi:hypothetical protein
VTAESTSSWTTRPLNGRQQQRQPHRKQLKQTTVNMEHSTPGAPQGPDSIDALITNLQRIQADLILVFGNEAPQSIQIRLLLEALYDKHNYPTPE